MNPETPAEPQKPTFREKARLLFLKFYSHQKIFWLITTLLALIFLIVIAGIIFRLTKRERVAQLPSPTPLITTVNPKSNEENKPLDLAKEELIKLGIKIKNLDIKQQRLTPPAVNFKVDF